MQLKLFAIMALFLVSVAYAACPKPITACCEITSEGTYLLANDIWGSTSDICIQISVNNVVLDGQYHTIASTNRTAGGNNLGIYQLHHPPADGHITIANISMIDWWAPILATNYNWLNISNVVVRQSLPASQPYFCSAYAAITLWKTNNTFISNVNITGAGNTCGHGIIINNQSTVWQSPSDNVTINNVIIWGVNETGIVIQNTSNVRISNVNISFMNASGIRLEKCGNVSINNVNISYMTDSLSSSKIQRAGIVLNATNATINNYLFSNSDANVIALYGSSMYPMGGYLYSPDNTTPYDYHSWAYLENSTLSGTGLTGALINLSDSFQLNITNLTYSCTNCFNISQPRPASFGANITLKQPARLFVENYTLTPLSGALCNVSSNLTTTAPLTPMASWTTAVSGYTNWENITEAWINATGAWWFNNYTINVTNSPTYWDNLSISANLSNGSNTITVMLGTSVLSGGGTCAGTPIHTCQHLLPGFTYSLDGDITNSASSICLQTDGPSVVLNGCGYTIDGIGASGSKAVQDLTGSFTFFNARISDFAYGFYGTGNSLVTSNIDGTNLTNAYFITDTSQSILITDNSFTNVYNGIFIASTVAFPTLYVYNSTFNAANSSLILRNSDNFIYNSTFNATCYNYLATGKTSTYYKDSFSNWGLVSGAPNMTFDIAIPDIVNTSGILIKSYNHDTLARINYANYTATDGFTTYYYDRYWLVQDYNFGGNTVITVSENTNYYPSYVVLGASWENGFSNQVLLIPKTASSLATVVFHLVDGANNPIPGATCGFFKQGITDYILVSSKKTDVTGLLSFIMQTTTNYKLMCEASGYSSYNTTLTPVSSDYTITLYSSTSGIGFPTDIEGIRTIFTPTGLIVWNASATLNFSITNTSINSSLEWFAWRVYNGTTLLNSQNDTTHPSGGSLVYTVVPGNTSRLTIEIIFKRIGRGVVDYNFYVLVYQPYTSTGGASLTDALERAKTTFGEFTIVIITLTMGCLIAGWVGGFSQGAAVAVFLGVLTMGFFISTSILSGVVLLTAFIIAAAYFMLRGGG